MHAKHSLIQSALIIFIQALLVKDEFQVIDIVIDHESLSILDAISVIKEGLNKDEAFLVPVIVIVAICADVKLG